VHRKTLIPQLAAKRIRAIEPYIAETSTHIWETSVQGGRIEWMGAMANRLPMMIVGRIIGVPDEDIDKIVRWGYAATQFVEGLVTQDQLTAAGVAVIELGGYITEQFHHATANPQGNLLGDLATACATGELDEFTAQVMTITLFSAGGESTASLIGSAAWILATHPAIQERLRAQPKMLGPFLEEVLRYEPPFRGHYRHVVRDTELGGVAMRAGSRLLLMWGAACVGAALARLEATVVIRQMLERTTRVRAATIGQWLPSLLVRRLDHLELTIT
jgi:cytochrome P450 family 144